VHSRASLSASAGKTGGMGGAVGGAADAGVGAARAFFGMVRIGGKWLKPSGGEEDEGRSQ
jgi:hypothetical protein